MSLLKDFLAGGQKAIPHEERTPLTCRDGTKVFLTENGSLLETKVTHAIVEIIKPNTKPNRLPIPAAWKRIPNEGFTYHNITAQSLKRFVTARGGEHELLISWYDTWKSIQDEYKTGQGQYDGLITEPGKFQTEMLYVPFFWEVALNGSGDGFGWDDETGRPVDWFNLDEWEAVFPPTLIKSSLDPDEPSFLFLWETDQGFVETEIKTLSEIPADGPMGDAP